MPSPTRFCAFLLLLSLVAAPSFAASAPAAPTPAATATAPTALRTAGQPAFRHYPPTEYHGHNQVWAVVEDARGVRHIASDRGVIAYDSETWRVSVLPSATIVLSLAADETAPDTLHVGGVNELGYFTVDPATGRRAFTSLHEQLPAALRTSNENFSVTLALPGGGAAFTSNKHLFVSRAGALVEIPLPGRDEVHLIRAGDTLFVQQLEAGLFRLDGTTLKPVSNDPFFHKQRLRAILPTPTGYLLLTRAAGFFTWSPTSAAPPVSWNTDADDLLKRNPSALVRLADGRLAVSMLNSGLLILSPEGRTLVRLDEERGLPSQNIYQLTLDRTQALWLATNNGLVRIETAAPASSFDQRHGLPRAYARQLLRHERTLYAMTARGLYALPDDAARWAAVPGIEAEGYAILGVPGGLLAANVDGLWWLADGQPAALLAPPIGRGRYVSLAASRRDPARVWLGANIGVGSVRREGSKWIYEGLIPGLVAQAATIAESPDGLLWLGTPDVGAALIRFDPPARGGDPRGSAHLTPLGLGDGPDRLQRASAVWSLSDGAVLFTNVRGFHVPNADFTRCLPTTRYGAAWGDGTYAVSRLTVASPEELWFGAQPAGKSTTDAVQPVVIGRLRQPAGAPPAWTPLPAYVTAAIGRLTATYYDAAAPGGPALWIAGTESLVRVDVATWQPQPLILPTVVRRVTTATGRELFAGDRAAPAAPLILPYTEHDLRFEFAAPGRRPGSPLEYQIFLEGRDRTPATWQSEPFKEFTNLFEGRYALRVRARQEGTVGPDAVLPFTVRPPAIRTPLAYALYAAAAALAIYGLVRWRLAASERERHRLERVVSERTAELVVARDAAESANRAKSTFLANMSHELRTPLNGILGYTQVLLKAPALDPVNRDRLRLVGASGEHLLRLINDVLDLSKVEAGKLELSAAPCDLRRLLATTADIFRFRSEEKHLTFTADLAPDLPATVIADEQKLRQVLFNILANAVKFTATGTVTLRVRRAGSPNPALRDSEFAVPSSGNPKPETQNPKPHGESYAFAVLDTGPGISAADLPRLFQPFTQLPANTTTPTVGTGLGLVLSQRMVALMGGTLTVESTPGHGSTFAFTLDLPPAPFPAPSADAPAITGYEGPPRRLLVVDDSAINRDILTALLRPLGFVIVEASDGADALVQFPTFAPDLVLLDLRMTPVDGFALARALRATPAGRACKLIAVSASAFNFDRADALAAGCDDFLPKPFAEPQLLALLSTHLSLRWTHTSPSVAPSDATPAPTATLAELRALAARGDIVPLRYALDVLAARDPVYAELSALAHRFQLAQLRERLAAFNPTS